MLPDEELIGDQAGHGGDQGPQPAQVGPHDKGIPLRGEAGEEQGGGHVADNLAASYRGKQRVAAHRRGKRLVQHRNAAHVSHEHEQGRKSSQQAPVDASQ